LSKLKLKLLDQQTEIVIVFWTESPEILGQLWECAPHQILELYGLE
jgi:hypothetical protein